MTVRVQDSLSVTVQRDEERLAAVRRYEILDAPVDGTFDRIAQLAAGIFMVPIATVTIVDEDRVWFAASHGLNGVRQIGAEAGLCASAVLDGRPYVVNDAAVDPRTLDHPLVRGELGLRFYAAAPVTLRSGHRLGTVNVIDRKPRRTNARQIEMLEALAGVVADHLELRLEALVAVRSERQLRSEADERASAAARLVTAAREAAAGRGPTDHPLVCELGGQVPCTRSAELKVADSWGDSAWGCVPHVEEAMLSGSSLFIADESMAGVAAFVNRGCRT